MHSKQYPRSIQGFTLLENLIIVVIIGILGSIAAPSWLTFVNVQRLNKAQDGVYRAMQEAKSNAKKDKITWQASFREYNGIVQWAVHPASISPNAAHWNNLDPNVQLDSETTLHLSGGVREILFNYQGCPVYKATDECTSTSIKTQGRIALSSKNGGSTKRCVIVSTLLGALRTAQEHPKPKDGKYCY